TAKITAEITINPSAASTSRQRRPRADFLQASPVKPRQRNVQRRPPSSRRRRRHGRVAAARTTRRRARPARFGHTACLRGFPGHPCLMTLHRLALAFLLSAPFLPACSATEEEEEEE